MGTGRSNKNTTLVLRRLIPSILSRVSSPDGGVPMTTATKTDQVNTLSATDESSTSLKKLAEQFEFMALARKGYAEVREHGHPSPFKAIVPAGSATLLENEGDCPPRRKFKPARIISNQAANTDQEIQELAESSGIDQNRTTRYKGQVTLYDLLNANVDDDDNHALHLTGIHPDATLANIFSIFTGVKVAAFNRQAPVSRERPNAAANLILMTRATAEALKAQFDSDRGLSVRGVRVSAVWSRHKVGAAALARFQSMSRVVCIKGPQHAFHRQGLLDFFEKYFKFDLVSSTEAVFGDGRTVTLYFTSIRAQAENADLLLRERIRENAKQLDKFDVSFGQDPCEVARWRPGPRWSADRAEGKRNS